MENLKGGKWIVPIVSPLPMYEGNPHCYRNQPYLLEECGPTRKWQDCKNNMQLDKRQTKSSTFNGRKLCWR